MTDKTQADRDAAARLNGYATWETWQAVPQHDEDWMQLCALDFARHRQYGYGQGYYDGRKYDGAEERAKIVAWLRKSPHFIDAHEIVDAIEAGEHEAQETGQ